MLDRCAGRNGMNDRERIVEVIARVFRDADHKTPFDKGYADVVLAALEAAGYAIVERNKCEPWLGCATTRQLIEELTARIDVLGQLDYSTVGGTPGLVPVGGDS